MIKEALKKKLKKVLKYGYLKEVQNNLIAKGFLTRNGTPFGLTYISDIMNGKYSHPKIEKAIIELYQVKQEDKRVMTQRRNEIFGIKE
jgi:hypothetical protein